MQKNSIKFSATGLAAYILTRTILNSIGIDNIKQENWFRLILRLIPLMCFFSFSVSPYIYYSKEMEKGYLRQKVNGDGYVYGQIEGEEFEIWEHTGNYISIHSNEKQIALIKRSKLKEFDGDRYRIIFGKSLEKHLAAIFCLLADALWHTDDTELYSMSWEFSYQLTGKKLDKNWLPED